MSWLGEEFNVNSPTVGRAFEKLGLLEYTKETKTGYSSAVDVWSVSPAVDCWAVNPDYRQIAKIQSTSM